MLKIIPIIFLLFSLGNKASADENNEINILKKLRCLVCESQSVYDSESDFAMQIKNYVKELNSKGLTNKEIENILLAEYGKDILLTPAKNGSNLVIWLFPYLLIIISAGYFYYFILKSKK